MNAIDNVGFRSGPGGNGHGSDDLLYRGRRNIGDSGAGAFVADFTGLARGNSRLDNSEVGEPDWCRRHRSPELFRIAPGYASLIGFQAMP